MLRVYSDNYDNRRIGRVGMPFGSMVVTKSGEITSEFYVDNQTNRRLGRVGEFRGSMPKVMYEQDIIYQQKPTLPRRYVNNAYNRRVRRVGRPVGSKVVTRDGQITTQFYVDSEENSDLGRVGAFRGSMPKILYWPNPNTSYNPNSTKAWANANDAYNLWLDWVDTTVRCKIKYSNTKTRYGMPYFDKLAYDYSVSTPLPRLDKSFLNSLRDE